MKVLRLPSLCVVGIAVVCAAATLAGQAQDAAPDLRNKVAELESRVARLERLLGVSGVVAPKTVRQAEQDLLLAQQRFEYCQRVGRKGYITPTRLAACRLDVEKAERQLALAKGDARPDAVALEIALLEAQFRLTAARERLRASEKMAATGLATQVQVNAARLAVERTEAQLQHAETRFERYREEQQPDN